MAYFGNKTQLHWKDLTLLLGFHKWKVREFQAQVILLQEVIKRGDRRSSEATISTRTLEFKCELGRILREAINGIRFLYF